VPVCREIKIFFSGKNVPQCHCGTTNPTWTAVVLKPNLFCEYCRVDEWVWRIGRSCDREIKDFSGEKLASVPLYPLHILYELFWH